MKLLEVANGIKKCKTCILKQNPRCFDKEQGVSCVWIVGQNPGITECVIGKPFQGVSGHRLDDALELAGLIRKMFYVTNIYKCYGNVTRNMSCNWILYEYQLMNPHIVLALGKLAGQYFHPGIKFGEWKRSSVTWVYQAYHPSPSNNAHKDDFYDQIQEFALTYREKM